MRRLSVLGCLLGLACSSEAPAPLLTDAQPSLVESGTPTTVVLRGVFEFDDVMTDFKTGQARVVTAGTVMLNETRVEAVTTAQCGSNNCVAVELPADLAVGPVKVQLIDRHGQLVENTDILKIEPAVDGQGSLQLVLRQGAQPVDGPVAPGEPLTIEATLVDAAGQTIESATGKAQLAVTPTDIVRESDFVRGVARFTIDNVSCDLQALAVSASDSGKQYSANVNVVVAGGELGLNVTTSPPFNPGVCLAANSVTIIDGCGNPARNPPQRIEAQISARLGSPGQVYLDSNCTVDALDMPNGMFSLWVDVPQPDTYSVSILGDGELLGTIALVVQPGPVNIVWSEQDLEMDAGECKTFDATVTDDSGAPVAGFILSGRVMGQNPGQTNIGTTCPVQGGTPISDADGDMTIGLESFQAGTFAFVPDNARGEPLRFTVEPLEAVRVEFSETLIAGVCAQIVPRFFDAHDNMVDAVPITIAVSNPRTSVLTTGLSVAANCTNPLRGSDTINPNDTLYARWNWAPELRLQPTVNGFTTMTSIPVNPAAPARLEVVGPKNLTPYACDPFNVLSVDVFGNPVMTPLTVADHVR